MNNISPINYTTNFSRGAPNILSPSSSSNPKEKKKLDFKCIKNNTISSLNDVEFFLNKLQNTLRYIKLYKLLK